MCIILFAQPMTINRITFLFDVDSIGASCSGRISPMTVVAMRDTTVKSYSQHGGNANHLLAFSLHLQLALVVLSSFFFSSATFRSMCTACNATCRTILIFQLWHENEITHFLAIVRLGKHRMEKIENYAIGIFAVYCCIFNILYSRQGTSRFPTPLCAQLKTIEQHDSVKHSMIVFVTNWKHFRQTAEV